MIDQNGDQITFPGLVGTVDPADQWIIAIEVISGPGNLGDNAAGTCSFAADGFCDLEMSLDTAGDDYVLNFTVKVGDSAVTTLNPLQIAEINLGGRPLSVKVTEQPLIGQKGVTFDPAITVSVWDDALDQKASASLVPSGVTCTLTLTVLAVQEGETDTAGTSLDGTLSVDVDTSSKSHENLAAEGKISTT